MVQFYLLAVVVNILGGLMLSSEILGERIPMVHSLRESLSFNSVTRIIIILVMLFVALFKILSVTEGDVPVVGDLLPALSLVAMAAVYFLEYYEDRSSVRTPAFEKLEAVFIKNRSIIGMVAVAAGVAHFLFPRVLFL
ncbi:MAG: hypothetical protein ACLFNZ_06570 [Spirochaetaceae bacterium]